MKKLYFCFFIFFITIFLIYGLRPNININKDTSIKLNEVKFSDDIKFNNFELKEKISKINNNNNNNKITDFYKEIEYIGWDEAAEKLISGELNKIGLTRSEIQNICDNLLLNVNYEKTVNLFKSGCHPKNSRSAFYLINSKENISEDDILNKLKLYKENGFLIEDVEYYIKEINYRENFNLYDRAVSFGYVEIAKYLDSNGISPTYDPIENQIRNRTNMSMMTYLLDKGYRINNNTNTLIETDDFKKRYPTIHEKIINY